MRILVTPEWYPSEDRPYFGQFCRDQARAAATEHDVVVLTWRVDKSLRAPFRVDETAEDGLRTFRVRFGHVGIQKVDGAGKLAGCLTVLGKLRRTGWAPDLIHAHEYEAGRTALMLSRPARAPVVVSEHWSGFAVGTLPAHDRDRARRVFERAAVVCPVSHDLGQRLRQIAPVARFVTVPNAVDTAIFRPDGDAATRQKRGRPLRLVTVASLVEVKGHRFLLEALALLAHDHDVELDLVGDGPLKNEIADQARSLGLNGRLRLHGAQPRSAVAARLREADVFVLPSLWENMPCALLEALACGLPAVATHVGDIPKLIDADAGVVVAPRSAQELAKGIAEVAARLDRFDRAEQDSRAEAAYGFAAVGRRWTEVYTTASARSS